MTGIKHAAPSTFFMILKILTHLDYTYLKGGTVTTLQGKEYDNANMHVRHIGLRMGFMVEIN
jgi:hypothetical protein